MEKKINREKELFTADRECNDKNVAGRKLTVKTEIVVTVPLTTGKQRKEKQQHAI